jgi:outer membrane immunogenic protein
VVSSVRVTVQPLVSSFEIRGVLIMKRLAIITSTLAAALVAAPAFAADPIDRVPAAIPAPMPIFNWTGLYAGIHGGWAFGSANQRYTGNAAYLAGPVAGGLSPGGFNLSPSSGIVGAQLGYNIQFGQAVLGIETDLSYLRRGDSAGLVTTIGNTALYTATLTRTEWLGSTRARAGFAFDRTLLYVTGGVAYGGVRSEGQIVGGGTLNGLAWSGGGTTTRAGWIVGVGAEHAFTNQITARIEYAYYDLGRVNTTIGALNAATAATGIFATQRQETAGHILRGGLNVRF